MYLLVFVFEAPCTGPSSFSSWHAGWYL